MHKFSKVHIYDQPEFSKEKQNRSLLVWQLRSRKMTCKTQKQTFEKLNCYSSRTPDMK